METRSDNEFDLMNRLSALSPSELVSQVQRENAVLLGEHAIDLVSEMCELQIAAAHDIDDVKAEAAYTDARKWLRIYDVKDKPAARFRSMDIL